jgi:hypothetical protein
MKIKKQQYLISYRIQPQTNNVNFQKYFKQKSS